MPRPLTQEELRILGMIQLHYGQQNTARSISWVNDDEATLWVRDRSGAIVLMVHLTNLGEWRLDGTITTDQELRRDWLQIESS